jgi:hypothetical protein
LKGSSSPSEGPVVAATSPKRKDMWVRGGVIRLNGLSISHLYHRPSLIGSAKGPGSDLVFVSLYAGVFMTDLESACATKVFERDEFNAIFPYMSFCAPGDILKPVSFSMFEFCGYLPERSNQSLAYFRFLYIYLSIVVSMLKLPPTDIILLNLLNK